MQNVLLDAENLPCHIAIIMDGNGRWAKQHFLARAKGHEKGSENVRVVVRTCRELNISALTLFAFSTENWQRPEREVNALMRLMNRFLTAEEPDLVANDIRFNVIGQKDRLPEKLRATIDRVMATTANNRSMLLNLALSYGSRTEITEMVRAVAVKVSTGELTADAINEAVVANHLYTRGIQDPDLLIRTSGELRISNFLLWQIAYAEIAVTPTLWPDFTREEFLSILKQYQSRDRRFGKVEAK